MSKLYFYTPIALDEAFLFTMGMSVKTSSNPIGFFGTGLKYAIAITLRIGGSINIATDTTKYEFSTYKKTVRGKEMDMITCAAKDHDAKEWDHKPMPMTTDYGKTWHPWMALRELYSNTLDEGGDVYEDALNSVPSGAYTVIEVDCPHIYDAWQQRDRYFLRKSRKPVHVEQHHLEIYSSAFNGYYYRGILVSPSDVKAGLTYNVLANHPLSEDRAMHQYYVGQTVLYTMRQCKDTDLLTQFFEAVCDTSTMEHNFPFDQLSMLPRSPEFDRICERVYKKNIMDAPTSMKNFIHEITRDREYRSIFYETVLNKTQSEQFDSCIVLLNSCGYDFTKIDIYASHDVEGFAVCNMKQHCIVFNPTLCLDCINWEEQMCKTLLEEYVHLKSGQLDYTAAFQDALTFEIYRQIKERTKQ